MVSATLVGSPAQAAVNYGVTITAVSPAKVPAGLGNRVIVITGTGFDEDQIVSIDLGADPDCAGLDSYVVSSPTTIAIKTPTANGGDAFPGCLAGVAQDVVIHQTESGTVTKTGALAFINPPALATTNPVITENSSALPTLNQVKSFSTNGGQLMRIKGDANTAFSGVAGSGLTGTFGGKPLTTVGFFAADGTTPQALTAAGSNGNIWVVKTGAALSAANNTLTIAQNSVSRTFSSTDTGVTITAVPIITSLDVSSGKSNQLNTVKITGTGFSTVLADWSVTFCGVAGAVTVATATALTVTTPATVGGNASGLGASTYAGVCPVVVTNANNGSPVSSPISPASNFTFLTS